MSSPSAIAATLTARLLLALIRGYQVTVSPALPILFGPNCGCRFHPTCSHYAADAVRAHGPARGSWLAFRRVLRCQPLHPGGIDPVPPRSKPVCRPASMVFVSPIPSAPPDLNG